MNQKKLNEQLLQACEDGNLELVKKLVNNGADIHCKFSVYTPFTIASINDNLNIVKWLYEQGADPTTGFNFAIRIASERGYLEVVKYLYLIGCDPTADSNYAIKWASAYGHLEVVKYLHSIGCDPSDDNNIENAIKLASSYYKNIDMVKFLALVGCDINEIDNIEMRKTAEYYKKYKPIMDQCIIEIYGNPVLERTKTENEISFREYLSK